MASYFRALIVGACILVILLALAANADDCKPKSNIKDLKIIIVAVPKPIALPNH